MFILLYIILYKIEFNIIKGYECEIIQYNSIKGGMGIKRSSTLGLNYRRMVNSYKCIVNSYKRWKIELK